MPQPPINTLLAGATGLVGRAVAARWQGPAELHLLVRRGADLQDLGGPHRHGLVVDFKQLPPLPAAEAALCCLGTTLAQAGSQAAFRAVDLDAVLAFARAAQAAGVRRFGLVSALAADASSGRFYNRVKGEAEDAVQALGFEHLVIVRPSLLLGNREALGQAPRPAERLARALAAPWSGLMPLRWRPVQAGAVAHALLQAVTGPVAGPAVRHIDSAALHAARGESQAVPS